MPVLSITSGPDAGARFRFDQSSIVTIGRGGMADVALTDASVSRRHALLAWRGGAWGVEDLSSANGTFVNGKRISQRTAVANGDSLRFGSVQCTYADTTPASVAAEATKIPAVENEASDSQIVLRVAPEAAAGVAGPGQTLIGSARRSRLVDSLTRISSMIFDERALLAFVGDELLASLSQADRAAILMWDAELNRFVPLLARARKGEPGAIAASQTLLKDVVTRKEAVLVTNVLTDGHYRQAESILALKVTSAICAPILFQNEILGVIQVSGSSGAAPFTKPDVALVMALALEVGMALSYARLHAKLVERELVERDLTLARRIQQHFLPSKLPSVPGYGFAVEYRPALAVGGDLYDFVQLTGGLIAIVVGDVSGKGISAALFAAKVTSDLRYQAAGQTSAAAILQRTNRVLAEGNEEGMFVTVSLAVIDPAAGRLTVASAGHPLPIVRDGSGQVVQIGQTGDPPLGLDGAAEFREYGYEFEPNDAVVLYTDGVIEAGNRAKDLYGDERLNAAIAKSPGGADRLVASISGDVRAFVDGHTQTDDVTVVCFDRQKTGS